MKITKGQAIISGIVITLFVFGFLVKKAGERRQACFSLGMIQKIMAEYYKHHGNYPESWGKFPKFYIVSPVERFYLDSKMLAKGSFGGYRYAFTAYPDGRIVISASPGRFCFLTSEFGITQDGILRENKSSVDSDQDGYDEVSRWVPRVSQEGKNPR